MKTRAGRGRAEAPAPPDPDDRSAAEATALRILSGAAQSGAGLRRRLERRGFSGETAEVVVEAMRNAGYVDDAALAGSIAARRSRDGYGRRRIAADLSARRIDSELVGEVLAGIDEDEEREAAWEAALRLSRSRGPLDRRGLQRVGAALQRRGFAPGVIRDALRRLGSEEAAESS